MFAEDISANEELYDGQIPVIAFVELMRAEERAAGLVHATGSVEEECPSAIPLSAGRDSHLNGSNAAAGRDGPEGVNQGVQSDGL